MKIHDVYYICYVISIGIMYYICYSFIFLITMAAETLVQASSCSPQWKLLD